MSNPHNIQIIYTDENGVKREAEPVPSNSNPVKQVIEVMKKVDLKSPDAKPNEVSIKDSKGKRIKLDDETVKTTYFKGVEDYRQK